MPTISMRQLLEAGVHFGHQTRRWNPKMKPYIFAERNGIHIIDLAQTVKLAEEALDFVADTVASGDYILFVGTKKQAQEPVREEAARAEMPYVNHRWLGGMLTNFVTIRKRVGLLDQLEARQASGDFDRLSKKEASQLTDEMARLQLKLGGVRKMRRLPGAIFVVDPQREKIAVTEARRLEIPVIATGDTNVDPDMIDFIIPANDDAIRAIRLLCRLVSDAAIEGMGARATRAAEEPVMGTDVGDAETASDEMVAAVAAGGTYSFAPEPDEDEGVLPGEEVVDALAAEEPWDETAMSPAAGQAVTEADASPPEDDGAGSAAEVAAADEPTAEEPAADEPAADEPATDKPRKAPARKPAKAKAAVDAAPVDDAAEAVEPVPAAQADAPAADAGADTQQTDEAAVEAAS
jgi:small subunit ribosomal protein S2